MTARTHSRSPARAIRSRIGGIVRGVRRRRFERRLAAPKLLRTFAEHNPDAFFIEIGANDGDQHDHLRRFILSRSWSGVMVEPVPYIFERLRRNYAGLDRIRFENAAIGERDGRAPFYYLVDAPPEERAQLPDWYDGTGSFSKDVVLGHARHMPDIADRLVCEEVPALTFDSLCRKHGVGRLDLIVIDTEGYDYELIRHIDLDRWRPQLLVYEHYHLAAGDRRACRELVRDHGFLILEEGFDTFCLGDRADARLKDFFTRLRPAVAGVSVHDELP